MSVDFPTDFLRQNKRKKMERFKSPPHAFEALNFFVTEFHILFVYTATSISLLILLNTHGNNNSNRHATKGVE